jgi:hypothetical protein
MADRRTAVSIPAHASVSAIAVDAGSGTTLPIPETSQTHSGRVNQLICAQFTAHTAPFTTEGNRRPDRLADSTISKGSVTDWSGRS